MNGDRQLEERLRRLSWPVDRGDGWAGIEAQASEGVGRARAYRTRRRRLRVALVASAAVIVLAGVAVGAVFAVRHFSERSPVLVIDDGTGMGAATQPGSTDAQPGDAGTEPGVDYSQGGRWEELPLTGGGGYVQTLVMDPSNPEVLYVATQEGRLYKTTAGAENWSEILSLGVAASYEVAVDPVSPSTVYVICPAPESPQILRSDDGGQSWTELDNSILLDSDYKNEYVWDGAGFGPPVADGAVEASTIYVDADSGSWRSVDRGESWSKVTREEQEQDTVLWWGNLPGASPLDLWGATVTDTEAGTSDVVEVTVADPDDPSVIYAGTWGGVYKSVDGGTTWRKTSAGMAGSDAKVFNLIPDPGSPSILYATTGTGIQKSTDGGASWDLVLAGGEFWGDLVDGGKSGSWPSLVVAPSSPSTLYAWNGDGISRSDDDGATWNRRAAEGLLTVDSQPTGYTGLLSRVDAADSDVVFALAAMGGYRSTDGGDTWAALPGSFRAWEALVDPNAPSTLYQATAFGVQKSVDAGATWTTIVPAETDVIYALDIDTGDPAKIYLLRRGEDEEIDPLYSIVRSADGGATWENVDFSGLGNHYDQLLFDPRSPETMYAKTVDHATEDLIMGVYRSTDGGATWQDITEEMITGDYAIWLVVGSQDGTLYGVSRDGLFKWAPIGE